MLALHFQNEGTILFWKYTGIHHSPEGSKEVPPAGEGEGEAPNAASKLGCSILVCAGVTGEGDGDGAMKEPPKPLTSERNV